MENLWEMIAKARGVELNEEFIWVYIGSKYKYKITTWGLNVFTAEQWSSSCAADVFIAGVGVIEKLPFRPQKDDVYYTFCLNGKITHSKWNDVSVDYARLIAGIVFRTREEAEAYGPTWLDRVSKL